MGLVWPGDPFSPGLRVSGLSLWQGFQLRMPPQVCVTAVAKGTADGCCFTCNTGCFFCWCRTWFLLSIVDTPSHEAWAGALPLSESDAPLEGMHERAWRGGAGAG